jgi:hypothetical protein
MFPSLDLARAHIQSLEREAASVCVDHDRAPLARVRAFIRRRSA